jgi:hypothetical protein
MRGNWRKLSIDPGLLMLAMGSSVCRIYHMRWTMLVLSFAPTAKPGPRTVVERLSILVLERVFASCTSLLRACYHYPVPGSETRPSLA